MWLLRSQGWPDLKRIEIQVIVVLKVSVDYRWPKRVSPVLQASCRCEQRHKPITFRQILNQYLVPVDTKAILSDEFGFFLCLFSLFPELRVHDLVLIVKVL